jgi:hypothetical protein
MKKLFNGIPVLNMLNTKYIIVPTRQEPVVVLNPEHFGNAWFVKELKSADDANQEILSLQELTSPDRCVIRQTNKTSLNLKDRYSGEGTITLESYRPNDLVYKSTTNKPQFAVFSEIWYPKGWNAYVDGLKTPHTCVNYLLRGMSVPAGKHTIEFKFEPRSYAIGNKIAYSGSILLILSLVGSFTLILKKKMIKLT